MHSLIELIIPVLTSMAGGGLMWIIYPRLRFRREGNKMRQEEFNAVSDIVEKSTNQISDLSDRLSEIEAKKSELIMRNIALVEQVSKLTKENDRLTQLIRQYMIENNPNMKS